MWLVHMCVPTTPPLLSHFTTTQKNQTREVYTRCQKISDEFQRKRKPGGLNQAGWPETFRKITKTPSLEQNKLSLNLCKKGHRGWPQGQAGRPLLGRPAPHFGHPVAPFVRLRFATSTPYSFLVSNNFIQILAN